ncbi:MAG: hypothetical protein EZS28_032328 [Streblomastix strix]|uniref:Uncharacterized protein n=1 Tax=Streblomastix strix TaxID=222440 RepID=A0A5J4UQT4_9EUKA|nr:MAG: hypothetical protein EZS28_032328 [Streblomastix strix]
MTLFEPITANITVAFEALESLHIDWQTTWKAIYEAEIKYIDTDRDINFIYSICARIRNRNIIQYSQNQL